MFVLFVSVPEVPAMTSCDVLAGGVGAGVGVGEPPPQPATTVKPQRAIVRATTALNGPNFLAFAKSMRDLPMPLNSRAV